MYKDFTNNYNYPLIITKGKTNFGARFYDFEGCVAVGDTIDEVITLSREGLALHLWAMEHDGDDIPKSTPLDKIKVGENEIVCIVDVFMLPIRAKMDNRPVKKTLTIPWYLNDLGVKKRVNFSQLLQEALIKRLGF